VLAHESSAAGVCIGYDTRFGSRSFAKVVAEVLAGAGIPVAMAKRNCREENGEIRFDYDMAIAEPFKTAGAAPQVDLWPLFAALGTKPLLVVRGERSDLLTTQTADKMQAVAPAMKLAVVPGVGHAPELNEPEATAAIDEFLLRP